MKWNSFAEKFPLLEGAEWEAFKESIRETKGPLEPITYRMVKGKKEGLDGRNRAKACAELHIACRDKLVRCPDDEVKTYILRRNVHRRHLTAEFRQSIVADLREEGQSERQIAESLGVSPATVHRDIQATASNEAVETVTGKDGKQRAATKPKILCARCQRIGKETPGCVMCREARATGKKRTPKPESADDAPVDAFGNPLPKRCRDAYCDPWIQETYDRLVALSAAARLPSIGNGMQKREKRLPWFHARDVMDGMGFVIDYLEKIIAHFKEFRPAGVCPNCEGKGCADCRSSGLVPRHVYKSLKEAKK